MCDVEIGGSSFSLSSIIGGYSSIGSSEALNSQIGFPNISKS